MNAQADTDSRKTTEAVTNTDRFLRWKILKRSRNVGSFSGNVLNLLPLPTLKCVFRGRTTHCLFKNHFRGSFTNTRCLLDSSSATSTESSSVLPGAVGATRPSTRPDPK